MHVYLESIGFGRIKTHQEMDRLTKETVLNFNERNIFKNEKGCICGEYSKEYAPDMGLTCCGEFDENGNFRPEYIFPYYKGATVSICQEVEFERHSGEESYAGACEDPRIGATLIFYLRNLGKFITSRGGSMDRVEVLSVKLSCLAKEGKILLPVYQESSDRERIALQREEHYKLIAEARSGDEDAIEELTTQDMEDYSVISKRAGKEDVFSIVETCILPFGVECDQYSILGTILSCDCVQNASTGEIVYQMQVEACDVSLDVCINEEQLEGIPEAGRRFKGLVWLQGTVCLDGN